MALAEDHVEVYRRPTAEGYQEVQRLGRGEQVAPQALADATLRIAEILG